MTKQALPTLLTSLLIFTQAYSQTSEPSQQHTGSKFAVEENVLLPIDSLYLNKIEEFYKNAELLSNKAWPGMTISPVCIFRKNGPAFLYHHPNPPATFTKVSDHLYRGTQAELQIFGATQAEINGVLTAICGYDVPSHSGPEEVFAELFHETHHAYQFKYVPQVKPDNPVTLLLYPENYENDALKIAEQKLMLSACLSNDETQLVALLDQINQIRAKRETIIGEEFIDYEKAVESLEGPAFYCQSLYYQEYATANDALKYNYLQKEFFGLLNTPYYGRDKLRYRHLASGMAMCYILDKYKQNWKKEFYSSEMKLYDYFIAQFNIQNAVSPEIEVDYAVSKFQTQQLIDNHTKNLQQFYNQSGIKIVLHFTNTPQFRGFDPMNAEAINDSVVLHSTLLKLEGSQNNELFITGWPVVTHDTGQIWHVDSVTLFVPEKEVEISDNRIAIKNENLTISWEGTLKNKSEKEILFHCN